MTDATDAVHPSALRAIFTEGRTPHTFDDTPVADHELRALWDLVKFPPTSVNSEPMRITWIRTPEGKQRLLKHAWPGNHVPISQAPVTALLAWDTRFYESLPHLWPWTDGVREQFAADSVRSTRVGMLSASMQAGYLVLAARALGLAAGPMEGFNQDELDNDFFPDGRFKSFLLMTFGHPGPDSFLGRGPRRADDEVMTWL